MTDRELISGVVAESFSTNPRIRAMLRPGNEEKRIRIMTSYAYDLVKKLDGVFLSSDRSTVMFYYRMSDYHMTFRDYIEYVSVFFRAVKLSQVIPTVRRERYIKNLRPSRYKDYIYVWVLGNVPGTRSLKGLAEVRDLLFGLSRELQLPILIETTVERVLTLYKYVGFHIYNQWYDPTAGINVWFLERPVEAPVTETSGVLDE